jgi:CHAD domain-containing protein
MLKKAKWVESSQATEPISQVARMAIRERLRLVWEYAPLAAEKWQDDVEFVHQMRVATRRSGAAFVTFADLLPKDKTRRMQTRLKKLRKASSEARDLDVLHDRLQREVKAGRGDLSPTLNQLEVMRRDAQPALVECVQKLAARNFTEKIDTLCERIRWRQSSDEPTYAAAAREMLRREIENFAVATEEDLHSSDALHQLRIEGKQLRYTMELLAGAFDDDFRQSIYPRMRKFQDKLGAINDHAAAHKRFQQWAKDLDGTLGSQFSQLAEQEQELAAQSRADFLAWWTDRQKKSLLKKLRSAAKGKP